MSGIPCAHAVCATLFDCRDLEDYVDEYYSLERYKKEYTLLINPMPSEGHDILEPPRARAAPGRPSKLRRRSPNDSREPKKSKQNEEIWSNDEMLQV